jgi:hypothetical protein
MRLEVGRLEEGEGVGEPEDDTTLEVCRTRDFIEQYFMILLGLAAFTFVLCLCFGIPFLIHGDRALMKHYNGVLIESRVVEKSLYSVQQIYQITKHTNSLSVGNVNFTGGNDDTVFDCSMVQIQSYTSFSDASLAANHTRIGSQEKVWIDSMDHSKCYDVHAANLSLLIGVVFMSVICILVGCVCCLLSVVKGYCDNDVILATTNDRADETDSSRGSYLEMMELDAGLK